jgi:hypothetical protein
VWVGVVVRPPPSLAALCSVCVHCVLVHTASASLSGYAFKNRTKNV